MEREKSKLNRSAVLGAARAAQAAGAFAKPARKAQLPSSRHSVNFEEKVPYDPSAETERPAPKPRAKMQSAAARNSPGPHTYSRHSLKFEETVPFVPDAPEPPRKHSIEPISSPKIDMRKMFRERGRSTSYVLEPKARPASPSAAERQRPPTFTGVARLMSMLNHKEQAVHKKHSPRPTRAQHKEHKRLLRHKSLSALVTDLTEAAAEDEVDEDAARYSHHEHEHHTWHDLHPTKKRVVLNPMAQWRVNWDILMLAMITYVMIVTPFELTFVSYQNKNNMTLSNYLLFIVNRFVDCTFVIDFFMNFCTAYFAQEEGRWVTDLHRIVWKYTRTWCFVDLISLVPWWWVTGTQATGLLRLVRLARLFKLLRVFQSPRIVSRLSKHMNVSSRTQTIIFYSAMLLLTIHGSACALRLVTEWTIDACNTNKRRWEDCPHTLLSQSNTWRDGIWAEYTSAIVWSFTAMNGEATFVTHAEGVLGFVMMLVGCILIAFLLGDLTNVASNLDPVSNDFKQTLDSINDYMTRLKYPTALKLRLREYVMLSEPVFRFNYYQTLLDRLSPSLQALVAQQDHGAVVNKVPFFIYAVHKFYDIRPGDAIRCRARRRRGVHILEWEQRPARVLRITPTFRYDLEFDLDLPVEEREVERNVPFSRLQLDEYLLADSTDARIMERVNRLPYQKNMLVYHVVRLLKLELRMARDSVILANTSINDALYIVRSGSVLLFGSDQLAPFKLKRCTAGDYFGDDIAMLISASKETHNDFVYRSFSARCSRTTQLHTLDALAFQQLVIGPQFTIFRMYIARYGVWMRLRMTILDHCRKVRQREKREKQRCMTRASLQKRYEWETADPHEKAKERRRASLQHVLDEGQKAPEKRRSRGSGLLNFFKGRAPVEPRGSKEETRLDAILSPREHGDVVPDGDLDHTADEDLSWVKKRRRSLLEMETKRAEARSAAPVTKPRSATEGATPATKRGSALLFRGVDEDDYSSFYDGPDTPGSVGPGCT